MSEIVNRSRLTLEKRHQLIDLNKEYVNFDITFECKAVDATKDFEIIVVNQEQLNTVDLTNLTMKRTKGGYISGNIIADEDKYQNYFLILRSATEDPTDVDLEIKIKQIEPKPEMQTADFMTPVDLPPQQQSVHDMDIQCHSPATGGNHVVFMVIGLLLIGGAVGYYFWRKSKSKENFSMDEDVRSVYSEKSSSSSSSDEKGILDTLINKSKST